MDVVDLTDVTAPTSYPPAIDVDHFGTQEEQASLPAHRPETVVQGSLASASPQGGSDALLKEGATHFTLPDFLEPIPTSLLPEDLGYLHKKGCFDIPAPKFRDALFRSYAEFFHPYMPLLDLGRFLKVVTSQVPQNSRVSLLLFQAIMFAGSAHVDIKPLRMLGFLTRKAARRALYLKTKTLYDLDYEKDRLCVIRVLIIMSHWYETPDDQKDACHWLQIAISLSRRAGLDQDPANMPIPEAERRIRRRIWWSCVNRDPLCALGLKSRLSLHPRDHDVPDLRVDDFELGDVPPDGFERVGMAWPPGKRRLLCLGSVWQTQLHKHLSDILGEQYKLGDYRSASQKADSKSTKMILLPVANEATRLNLEKLETRLQSWYSSLPSELQTAAVGSEIPDSGFESFVVFRTALHMLYHTCRITLHRPWVRSPQNIEPTNGSETEGDLRGTLQASVRRSAQAITNLAMELHQIDLVRHLPQTGISALVAAVVSHISDMLASSDDVQRAGLKGFEQCSHLLNELRENYYSADFSADFVKLLAQARKLTDKSKLAETSLNFVGEVLDNQVSAQSGFAALHMEPQSTDPEFTAPPVLRPLPEALFPEGINLSSHEANNQNSQWSLIGEFDSTVDAHQAIIPSEFTEDWDSYRNFRDETVRLLGDIYEDFLPGQFGTLPEIDALSG
ncbi:hypothetical protein LTR84_001412 [Exophiala bonariae]|uniref:Xylanolytic transcriptional activator regulatory domain-containing protein n=1 Tax=Exophiala bonariae TaxID=1690606 RepID=A0AAV9NG89_9EURO|nr:hypothetical protein LTR84_001412 [Exophiala bonariae]